MSSDTSAAPLPTDEFSGSLADSAQPCRYCSVVSKVNGEDPIGTAITASRWLFIEVPQPWAKNPWETQRGDSDGAQSADLLQLFQLIERQPRHWQQLRILAIAPDKTDSTAAARHVFFYHQPNGPTAAYRQRAYHVPTEQLCALVRALILQPAELDYFDRYLKSDPARALFVCTHTQYDLACGRFGTPIYRRLRQHYAQAHRLSVWQTTHFGGHSFAPTLIDFPIGQFWGHLEPEILDALVYRKGDVQQLQRFYRGWSGFSKWAQIAERSLWMQQGWSWLTTAKSARIVRQDPGQLSHRLLRLLLTWIPTVRAQVLLKKLTAKLIWAEVEICWEASPDNPAGCALVRVETSHRVNSQLRSGEGEPLTPVNQYRVSLIKIDYQ
jgi:hypothetical protein